MKKEEINCYLKEYFKQGLNINEAGFNLASNDVKKSVRESMGFSFFLLDKVAVKVENFIIGKLGFKKLSSPGGATALNPTIARDEDFIKNQIK